jgi:hypothetical protein
MVGAPPGRLYARRGGGSRGRGEASWPIGGRRFSGPRRRWRRGSGVLRRWRCPLAEGSMAAARAKSGPDLGPAGRGRCKLGQFVAVYAVATEVNGGRVRPAMQRRCRLVRLVSAGLVGGAGGAGVCFSAYRAAPRGSQCGWGSAAGTSASCRGGRVRGGLLRRVARRCGGWREKNGAAGRAGVASSRPTRVEVVGLSSNS